MTRREDERMTKQEFYEEHQRDKELVQRADVMKCTCPELLCMWHGKCRECVAIHRHKKEHVPACLQPILAERLAGAVALCEMGMEPHEPVPQEYRQYLRDREAGKIDG